MKIWVENGAHSAISPKERSDARNDEGKALTIEAIHSIQNDVEMNNLQPSHWLMLFWLKISYFLL